MSILKGRKKGIDDLLKVRENRAKRLRAVITDAVSRYGIKGKSGNRVLELWDAKLFTRNTEAVELNENVLLFLQKNSLNMLVNFINKVFLKLEKILTLQEC